MKAEYNRFCVGTGNAGGCEDAKTIETEGVQLDTGKKSFEILGSLPHSFVEALSFCRK